MRESYSIEGFVRRGYQDLPNQVPTKKKISFFKKLSAACVFVFGIYALSLSYTTIKSAPTLAEQKKVDKKIKFLASELIELKKYETELKSYEDQLKLRSELIDTILGDINDFDYERLAESTASEESVDHSDNGMGGGIESEFSLFRDSSSFLMPSEKRKLASLETSLNEQDLLAKLDLQLGELSSIPLGLPAKGRLSSLFGHRHSPFKKGSRQMHQGLDIAVDWQSPVAATADGTVVQAKWKGAYGKAVMIDHGNGLKTLYGHLTEISVQEGDKVCRGQQIGFAGSTGRSTGPHVHYEVRVNGKPKNPMPFVRLASYLNLL